MEETLLSRRLVAVWFADIVGYSARAAEDETGALGLVEILQTLSRETVRRYGGRVVKFLGDAVLTEIPSTDLAVRAAVLTSRSRSVWCTLWNRQKSGIIWLAQCHHQYA